MTTPPTLTNIPLCDIGAEPCYSTLAGDSDLAELVALFVSELPQRLADIRQAAQDQNWQEVGRLAHQLRGAGGSYGFPPLTLAAQHVESTAREQPTISSVRLALDQLTAVADRVRA